MCQSFSYSYRDQHALPPLEPGLDPLLPLTRHQHTCLYNYNAKKKLNQNDKLYQTIHFIKPYNSFFFQHIYYILQYYSKSINFEINKLKCRQSIKTDKKHLIEKYFSVSRFAETVGCILNDF